MRVNRWWRYLRRLREMPGDDRARLVEAWLSLARARMTIPRGTSARGLDRLSWLPGPQGRAARRQEWEPLARAIDIAARHHLCRMTCLPKSLALRSMLSRRGLESTLRIGVRNAGAGLESHAWVESGGVPIGFDGDRVAEFSPLVTGKARGRPQSAAPDV
jgi:Transglutaminase-like superfamily